MQAGAASVLLVVREDVSGGEAGDVDGGVAKGDCVRAKEFAACVRVGDATLGLDLGGEGVCRRVGRGRGRDGGDGRCECAGDLGEDARAFGVGDVDAGGGILRGKSARRESSAREREEVAASEVRARHSD
jgi:hypothetical protein